MSVVLQYDARVKITYAYHNITTWDKTLKKPHISRILIGKLDPETGEIVKTPGNRRKKQLDEAVIDADIAAYNRKVQEKKRVEKDILSESSVELMNLKKSYLELQYKYEQFGRIMTSFAKSINQFFGETSH